MKCIQISINGKVVCTAGHKDMTYVTATLHLLNGMSSYRFIASGKNDPEKELTHLLRYLDLSIKEGQQIALEIVDIDKPDIPARVSSFGTHRNFTGEEEHFCSFCGQSEKDVDKLIIGVNGNICNVCIKKHAADSENT